MPAPAAKQAKNQKKHIGILKLSEDISFQPMEVKEMKPRYENGIGVLDNVKILGYKSRNKNRRYLPEGIKVEMYEGKEVYVDHPDPEDQKKPRRVTDKFGWLEGVYKTDKGLFAKHFKFNPKHPIAEQFKFWAEKNPRQIGFSQNAFGDVFEAHDGELVEEVTEVRSIDLVADPATTKGLYEAYTEVEKGEGHTGYEGEPSKSTEDTKLDKSKLAPSSPGPSSSEPTEKLVLEDEEEEEETDEYKDTEGGREKPEHLEEDEGLEEDEEDGDGADSADDDVEGTVGESPDLGNSKEPASTETVDTMSGGDDGGIAPDDDTAAMDSMDFDISPELEAAAGKIVGDANLDLKTKIKRLAHLLKLHPNHVEESVQIKDLPQAKRVARKVANKYKLNSVKMILEAFDKNEVAEALRQKKLRVNKLLKAANLPDDVITEDFRAELLECKDDRRVQMKIEDRRKLVEALKPKVRAVKPRSVAGAASGGVREEQLLEQHTRNQKPKRLSKQEQEAKLNEFESNIFAGVSGFGDE